MDQQSFNNLFRDLISHLYDPSAIEAHPLAGHFPLPEKSGLRRAELIQQLILAEIESLRPAGKEALNQSPEWRPYLILRQRYAEGNDPRAVAASLFIGDRQFRRDHSRALQALSARLWNLYFQPGQAAEEESPEFDPHPENLDLNEILRGVMEVAHRRLEAENIQTSLTLAASPPAVFADRVLLRQILLSLLNYLLHLRSAPLIKLSSSAAPLIALEVACGEQWAASQNEEQESLHFARRLVLRLPARLEESYPPPGVSGIARLQLIFPGAQNAALLVIDDQPAALKMFQRYLSRTPLNVSGLHDASLALETVRQTRPALVVLDVMMPRVDGWEILQALKLDPLTREIPVLVCSAWGEPELARSLGASAFLKKPIVQKELLETLKALGL
ncbi:MAG: hypothetical protein OHK0031_05350 [Anaerolineales bacterium]